jgi:hypothetical protein
MKKESEDRRQETGAPNGQARVKILEEDHVRRIAVFSEKLQEFRSCRSYRIKKIETCPGPDFLKRVFSEKLKN